MNICISDCENIENIFTLVFELYFFVNATKLVIMYVSNQVINYITNIKHIYVNHQLFKP